MIIGEIPQKEWSITNPQRGWSLNAERTWHFHKRAKLVKVWRDYFKEQAELLEIPRLDKISVEVFTTFSTRALQDPGNNMPAVKAAIDGLTDAGIIEDDVADCVAFITYYASTYVKGYNSITLLVKDQSE